MRFLFVGCSFVHGQIVQGYYKPEAKNRRRRRLEFLFPRAKGHDALWGPQHSSVCDMASWVFTADRHASLVFLGACLTDFRRDLMPNRFLFILSKLLHLVLHLWFPSQSRLRRWHRWTSPRGSFRTSRTSSFLRLSCCKKMAKSAIVPFKAYVKPPTVQDFHANRVSWNWDYLESTCYNSVLVFRTMASDSI